VRVVPEGSLDRCETLGSASYEAISGVREGDLSLGWSSSKDCLAANQARQEADEVRLVSWYQFHQRTEHGWRYAGWNAADDDAPDGETPVLAAFRRPARVEELSPGEYRYQRSDQRHSLDGGYLTLDVDGTFLPGSETGGEQD